MDHARANAAGDDFAATRYFTDGMNLYRFVRWLSRSVETALLELEDCHSLNILVVSAQDLHRAALRPVR